MATSLESLLDNIKIRPNGTDPIIIRQNFQQILEAFRSLTEAEHTHDDLELMDWLGM